MSTKRTFIAIEFSAEVILSIQQYSSALRDSLQQQQLERTARFVNPQNIHLTLRFLGDTSPNQVAALQSALQQIAQNHTSFRLRLQGLGCFPHLRKPSVIWTALSGSSDKLANLQQAVEILVQKTGFAPETKSFQPHITLARVERSALDNDIRRLGSWVEQMGNSTLVRTWSTEINVHHVSFVESTLKPAGAIYTSLGSFPLAKS